MPMRSQYLLKLLSQNLIHRLFFWRDQKSHGKRFRSRLLIPCRQARKNLEKRPEQGRDNGRCMYVCICTSMYIYMHICMYLCLYLCLYAFVHLCICVCMYICPGHRHVRCSSISTSAKPTAAPPPACVHDALLHRHNRALMNLLTNKLHMHIHTHT